jgi:hypothetical protein
MLVARKPFGQIFAQVLDPKVAIRNSRDRDGHLAPLFVRPTDDRDLDDAGMVGKDVLYLRAVDILCRRR